MATILPTLMPSVSPTVVPTLAPSLAPSLVPSLVPSLAPSAAPSRAKRCYCAQGHSALRVLALLQCVAIGVLLYYLVRRRR